MNTLGRLGLGAACVIASLGQAQAQDSGELLRRELEAGRAAVVIGELRRRQGADPQARLGLGIAQFTRAVERFAHGLHRYGFKMPDNPFMPFLRLPLPLNDQPEAVDYERIRAIYQTFLDDLAAARQTLKSVRSGNSKVVLNINAIRLSLGAGGRTTLVMSQIIDTLTGWSVRPVQRVEPWEVALDRADALWLAGYSHLLSAGLEFILAHDWRHTFDATAHAFFTGHADHQRFADLNASSRAIIDGEDGFADQIALLHLIHWPAGDRARMAAAHAHLKSVLNMSRLTWQAVLAETDDDREWLPAPRQNSTAMRAMPITDGILAGWLAVLDELDDVLDGRKLLPHWRFSQGIDVSMIFKQPQPFDLILLLTGHGVQPFLKPGPKLDGRAWQRWNQIFGNNLLGYAFYFN